METVLEDTVSSSVGAASDTEDLCLNDPSLWKVRPEVVGESANKETGRGLDPSPAPLNLFILGVRLGTSSLPSSLRRVRGLEVDGFLNSTEGTDKVVVEVEGVEEEVHEEDGELEEDFISFSLSIFPASEFFIIFLPHFLLPLCLSALEVHYIITTPINYNTIHYNN